MFCLWGSVDEMEVEGDPVVLIMVHIFLLRSRFGMPSSYCCTLLQTLVSNLRFLLSQGKKNCMTQDLYRAKGLTDILAVVFARLQRLGEPT